MKNLFKFFSLAIFVMAITISFIEKPTVAYGASVSKKQVTGTLLSQQEDYLHGVWVTTVYNLDFPSSPSLSEDKLKQELTVMLDDIEQRGLSDVFFQVRPQADAFYYSDIFNPSVYLTGNQDVQAPFDVLEYVTQMCHERNLKIHAWINPYRITKKETDVLSSTHIAVTNPELTVKHTDGNLYFNPALPQVEQLIKDGIEEIILNYDVDGIHFDDYFYPSKTFDDANAYNSLANGRSLDEFRRDSITSMISGVNDLIKEKAPDVLFGVSPVGIWANSSDIALGSDTNGNGSYLSQYADTRGWVKDEIIDYIAPQIYWNIGFEIAEYKTLVDWWSDVAYGTNVKLYIGHANYKETDGSFKSGEIDNQVAYNKTKDNVDGSIYFRYKLLG